MIRCTEQVTFGLPLFAGKEEAVKKYSIIYADPPWRYKVYSKKGLGRSAESHYPTMELEDIRALPVGTLAADDCVLFLWTTIPLLHDCFSVMRAWGFSYKTVAFVWIKQNRKSDSLFWGMGHWTRANAEFCMLATKGHPKRRSAGCIKSSSPTLRNTAKSRRKQDGASSS